MRPLGDAVLLRECSVRLARLVGDVWIGLPAHVVVCGRRKKSVVLALAAD
jgi:hypothetical protein